MKNLARWYSVENLGCEPWIWNETCPAGHRLSAEERLSLAEWEDEVARRHACGVWPFVVEDGNRPGDIHGFDEKAEALKFIAMMSEEGCCFFFIQG